METKNPTDSPNSQEEKETDLDQKKEQRAGIPVEEEMQQINKIEDPENNANKESSVVEVEDTPTNQSEYSKIKETSKDVIQSRVMEVSVERSSITDINSLETVNDKKTMYTEISNELANSIDVEGDIETAILQDAQNSEIPKVESFKKPQEDVTEEILKDKVYTLQNLMKRVRKNFGILPASLKKRKSNECESNSEMFTKKLAVDIDEDLLLDQEREQLMSRLKSFSNIYYEKPRPLSALDCAQYGWSYLNTTFEQGSFIAVLECSYCSKNMFMADLDLQFCTKLQAEKIQTRYNEGLHAWHKNDCLWREKKFRIDDVYKLPVVSLTETANRIRREGKKISSQNIPPLQNELSESVLKRVRLIIRDAEDILDEQIDSTKLNSYLLTLFGWVFSNGEIPGISCELCFALCEFKEGTESIDAVKEHQAYCPWRRNILEGNSKSDKPYHLEENRGFNLMIQAVKKEYEILVRRHYISYRNKSQQDDLCQKILKDIFESRQSLSTGTSLEPVDQNIDSVNMI